MILTIPYKSTMVDLESGDLLLLMTDGITEPRNAEGVMWEESGKLGEVLSSIYQLKCQEKRQWIPSSMIL